MKVQLEIFQATSAQFQVNRFQVCFVLKNVLISEPCSDGHLGPEFSFPALKNSNLGGKRRLNSGIGYQYLTDIYSTPPRIQVLVSP